MNHSKKVNDAVNWIFVSFKIFFYYKVNFFFYLSVTFALKHWLPEGGACMQSPLCQVAAEMAGSPVTSRIPDAPGIRGAVTLHLLKQNMIDVCLPCRFHWRHHCTFILAIPSHTSSAPSPSRVGFIRPAE